MTSLVIAGVNVTPITLAALQQYIAMCIKSKMQVPLFYANIHAITLAQRDREFQSILNAAPVVFCDGIGVQLAARLLGKQLPERFTPPDWIDDLARRCAERGWRMFLLGSGEGIAAKAAGLLQQRYPALVVESHHGYFQRQGQENDEICAQINAFAPDVLLVGFGMPLQEKWIAANSERLDTHVILAVGALFDYMTGTVVRGPRWLTDNGFEWLCRLVIEPRRLWRRYLLGNPYFLFLVLRQWWKERFARVSE